MIDDDDELFFDDDDMPVTNSVSKFLDKIIYNVLCKRKHKNVSDDLFFNNVKDHESVLTGTWRAIFNTKYREYREYRESLSGADRDNVSRYFLPSDFLTEEDAAHIMQKMVENCPWVKEAWVLSPHTKVVADLLDIDHNETIILNLALAIPTLDYGHRDIFERMMYNEDFRVPSRCYSVLFGIPENQMQRSLNGFLMASGFLVPSVSPKGLHTIDSILSDAFTNPALTRESIETFLFPSNITTDLTIENYSHLEDEIKITESIINKGLERETVGMNVMLWGLPGTGKTECAIVLAKNNNWNLKIIGDISAGDSQEKSRAQRITSLRVAMKLYSRNKDTVLLFDEMEDLFRGQKNDNFSKAFVNRIIETTKTPIIWTTNAIEEGGRNALAEIGSAVLRRMVYNICFEVPPVTARKSMWKGYNEKYKLNIEEKVLNNLAETYDMVPALINNAAKITSMSGISTDKIPDVLSSLDTLMHFGNKRTFDVKALERDYAPYNTALSNTDLDLDHLADRLIKVKKLKWNMCAYGAPGTGKAQPLYSKIATPGGWITMGDVVVDSVVLTPDGKSAKVTNVFPQGNKPIFRITFYDGRQAESCGEHLWRVYNKDWASDKILTLIEIQHRLKNNSGSLYIPLSKPIEFLGSRLPIHPYVVGALIGDGSYTQPGVQFTSADQEIIDHMSINLPDGCSLSKYQKKYGYGVIGIRPLLDGIGMFIGTKSEIKSIPRMYIEATVAERYELLRGLMDTDGTVGKISKEITYSTSSFLLAMDVIELVRSLGGWCKISKKLNGLESYTLSIRHPEPHKLFNLSRKKSRVSSSYQYSAMKLRIKDVEYIGEHEAQCIMIDHPDHLYITDDCVVTHNSHYGRHLAERLGKKLIIKEASDILGMYVGENEKNIRDAFKQARDEERILLIDEGDSFLRSRKLAKQSWEASLTNTMLVEMEKHNQPFILTTNLMTDLDEAAMRRFNFKIKFDFVKPTQAKKLFLAFFGMEAPDEIEKNYVLAPGDFATVKENVDLFEIDDPKEIYTMLLAECALKPQQGKQIGFSK
jgi:SpoVK/Ycf46/Vps4 family AAA+-type ATPase